MCLVRVSERLHPTPVLRFPRNFPRLLLGPIRVLENTDIREKSKHTGVVDIAVDHVSGYVFTATSAQNGYRSEDAAQTV